MSDNLLDKFIKNDKIFQYPKNPEQRLLILSWLRDKFEKDKKYKEIFINMTIKKYIDVMDHAFFRRELIDHKLLNRDEKGIEYWIE